MAGPCVPCGGARATNPRTTRAVTAAAQRSYVVVKPNGDRDSYPTYFAALRAAARDGGRVAAA